MLVLKMSFLFCFSIFQDVITEKHAVALSRNDSFPMYTHKIHWSFKQSMNFIVKYA